MNGRRFLYIVILLSLTSIVGRTQTIQQADSLHQRGRELADEGKIIEARACDLQAMKIRKKLFGEVNEDYISSLNNYAVTFSMEDNYEKASELQEHMMDLCAKLKSPHPKLELFAQNTGYSFYKLDNKEKAVKYWEMALSVTEKFSEKYEALLNGLGLLYEEMGDKQGENRIMGLMEEHNQHELVKPCNEPKCMIERAQYYGSIGKQAMAKECYMKALDMPMDNEIKIAVYEAYGQFLAMQVQDKVTGAEHQYKASILRRQQKGEDVDYANAIYKAGLYYSGAMTNECWSKALECYDNAMRVYQRLNDGAMIVNCQQKKGNAYSGLHDYAKAKNCYQEALTYYEVNDKENDNYPKMIEHVASAEKFNKEYEAAITHYQQALKIYEQRGMIEEYSNAENGLALCYAYAGKDMSEVSDGKYDDAIKAVRRNELNEMITEAKQSLEITRNYLGKLSYAQSLALIANCYAMKEEYEEAIDYYKQYMEVIREAIREEFRLQNETERLKMWEEEARIMNDLQELLAELPESYKDLQDDIASLVYDAELLSKGILLNSSIEFEKLLNQKNDKYLSDIYRQTKANRKEIERLRKETSTDAELERIMQLMQENQRLQVELNKGCQEMDDYTHYISYNWKDVQSTLSAEDVCIEFSSVDLGIGETEMIALVLTKDMYRPVAVTLWNEFDLMTCAQTEFYQDIRQNIIASIFNGKDKKDVLVEMRSKLDTIDTPFKPELSLYLHYLKNRADTTKGVFVAGEISWMKYQNLLLQDDVLFTTPDVGDIVWGRLSTYLKEKKRIYFSADGMFNHLAIEYLQYNGQPLSEQFEVYRLSSTKELCYKRKSIKLTKAALFGDINYNDDAAKSQNAEKSLASLRGSASDFADLGNTLREVNDIQLILMSKGIKDAVKFLDTEASKNVFMNMSDSKVNLLHIATHGMYKDDKKSTDAESMQNSLLAFAGANLDDNALVTAADIATMNLRQCDLAVLSACETGLGKLGGDGVFGLQRGFKNAGVHTLLMSLKNVYDKSTADLMISFYQNLMNGSTKREALVKAQQEIRNKGYKDPKYWATFILLDAD